MNGREFRFNWRVTAFAAVFLVLFTNLGFWQLNREVEKRQYIAERQARLGEAPLSAVDLMSATSSLVGARVVLSGGYESGLTLLKDNVVLNGQVGIEVHQLFNEESGYNFLVNRGFVPMGRTRTDPVEIPSVENSDLHIVGSVYVSHGDTITLGESAALSGFPVIVQKVEIGPLEQVAQKEIYPHVIRLAAGEAGALPRYWPDTVMPPEKHRGYAIQWFMMALAVGIAWLFFSFPRKVTE